MLCRMTLPLTLTVSPQAGRGDVGACAVLQIPSPRRYGEKGPQDAGG